MEIKCSKVNGYGLYSSKSYSKNEIIHILNGDIYTDPTKYTIHVGNGVHILDMYGRYMNHSFTPTTYIDGCKVVAFVDIDAGDELTFDYNKTEIEMAEPFVVGDVLVGGKIYY